MARFENIAAGVVGAQKGLLAEEERQAKKQRESLEQKLLNLKLVQSGIQFERMLEEQQQARQERQRLTAARSRLQGILGGGRVPTPEFAGAEEFGELPETATRPATEQDVIAQLVELAPTQATTGILGLLRERAKAATKQPEVEKPLSPTGKTLADRAKLVQQLGEKSPQVQQFDRLAKLGEEQVEEPLKELVLQSPDILQDLSPTDRGKALRAIAKDPRGRQFITNQNQNALQFVNSGLQAIDELNKHPGKAGALGFSGILTRKLPGSPQLAFDLKLKQLKALLVLPELKVLRGLGHMSDREFGTVDKAASALDPKLDKASFEQELKLIEERLKAAKAKILRQSTGLKTTTERLRFNPATGKIE